MIFSRLRHLTQDEPNIRGDQQGNGACYPPIFPHPSHGMKSYWNVYKHPPLDFIWMNTVVGRLLWNYGDNAGICLPQPWYKGKVSCVMVINLARQHGGGGRNNHMQHIKRKSHIYPKKCNFLCKMFNIHYRHGYSWYLSVIYPFMVYRLALISWWYFGLQHSVSHKLSGSSLSIKR